MVALESFYKVNLQTEFKRFPKTREEDITEIREWIATQPHLPPLLDVQIAHYLHASYYDVNVAKDTIEYFHLYKNSMPEFLSNWDPTDPSLFDVISKVLHGAFLPKKSAGDCQILLMRLANSTPDLYSFSQGVKWLIMSITAQLLEEGQQPEFKIVYDAKGYTMSHVMRNPLSSVRNYLDFGQKASGVRVVEIHFINSSPVIKKLMTILKPFMNKHITQMLHFHTSAEGFFKTVPSDVTPSDYGGSGPSIKALHDENVQRVLDLREALITYSLQKADETKRPSKKKKSKVETEFRKLEID